MNATNCPRCGRFFTRIRSSVCPVCEKAEEELFQKLKAYIEENPLCRMAELAEATDVSTKRITQFIRDGRLEISKGMMGEITCDSCGAPIRSGHYCDKCAVNMSRSVDKMFGKVKDDSARSRGMHTSKH